MAPLNLTKSEKENNKKTPNLYTTIKIGKRERCLVHGAHALILRVSKYAGLAPLRFEPHTNGWIVTISSSVWLYSYILITVLLINSLWTIFQDLQLDTKYSVRMDSSLSRIVALGDILIVVATACLGVYNAPLRMRMMMSYTSVLTEIDRRLNLFSGPLLNQKMVITGWLFLGYFIIFIFLGYWQHIHMAVELRKCLTVAYQYIGFHIQYIIVVILELQFAFTALSVLARFAALNHELAQTVTEAGISVGRSSRLTVSPSEAVRRLATLHGTLCDVAHQIGTSYGLSLIVILLSLLLHLVVTPYYLVLELVNPQPRPWFVVAQMFWCITNLFRLLIIVEPCYLTKLEEVRTATLLSQLIIKNQDKELTAQVEMFNRQLCLRRAMYSPMEVCVLDRPLIASISGAVTTYLVILIQFQNSSSN